MKKLVSILLIATLLFASATALAETVEYDFEVFENDKWFAFPATKADSEQRYYVTQKKAVVVKVYYGVRADNDLDTRIANTITVAANTANVKHRESYNITAKAGKTYKLATEIEKGVLWVNEVARYNGSWTP